MPVRRSAALLLAAAAIAAAGCSKQGDPPPVAPACVEGAPPIARALRAAPAEVRLADGTTISGCLKGATTESDLQTVGGFLTRVAEDLEDRAVAGDERAALELGYLVGAARRGAGGDTAVQAELVRRLERSASIADGAGAEVARALRRGMEAGEARG